jgi:hypothetical protein
MSKLNCATRPNCNQFSTKQKMTIVQLYRVLFQQMYICTFVGIRLYNKKCTVKIT